MRTFELADLRVAPGEVGKGHLGHVALADGTRVGVPVVIINGVDDGPTLVVTAAVHGTEVVGVGALLEVVRKTNPAQLRGRLVAITVANPFAFQVGSYLTPLIAPGEGMDLSGIAFWSASSEGRLTERIAAIIAPALEAASHVIDVHSNMDLAIPFVLVNWNLYADDEKKRETARMAEAWGTTVIEMSSNEPTGVRDGAAAHGIPAIMPELTGSLFLREENVGVGATGITNVMKAIGMLDGPILPQPALKLKGDYVYHGRLTTNAGGLRLARQLPGVLIPKGSVAVEIVNVWGDTIEKIRMPIDGYCWAFTCGVGCTNVVPAGSGVAYLFRERGQS